MLFSMCASLIFVVFDILSVTGVIHLGLATGVEPFWKVFPLPSSTGFPVEFPLTRQLSFIFKCLSDIVILDDFKTALDRIRSYWMRRIDSSRSVTGTDERQARGSRGSRGGSRPSDAVKDLESGITLPPLQKPSVAAATSHNELDFLSRPHLHVQGASSDSAGESTLHPLATYPSGHGAENLENLYGGLRSSI